MKAIAEKIKNKTWVFINGQTFSIENESSNLKRRDKNLKADSKEILAPMPGKITEINVEKGDKIRREQVVIIMEAMKMEYTLKSGSDGEVTEVRAVVGSQVNLGDLLVKVK